jgi:hypothetical protein
LEWWEGVCSCGYKIRTYIEPSNEMTERCPLCAHPILMNYSSQPLKPTREQITVWSELGARAVPKIERIQHEFDDTSFVFTAKKGVQPDAI